MFPFHCRILLVLWYYLSYRNSNHNFLFNNIHNKMLCSCPAQYVVWRSALDHWWFFQECFIMCLAVLRYINHYKCAKPMYYPYYFDHYGIVTLTVVWPLWYNNNYHMFTHEGIGRRHTVTQHTMTRTHRVIHTRTATHLHGHGDTHTWHTLTLTHTVSDTLTHGDTHTHTDTCTQYHKHTIPHTLIW